MEQVSSSNTHHTRPRWKAQKRPRYNLSSDSETDMLYDEVSSALSQLQPTPSVPSSGEGNDLQSFRSNKYIKMPDHKVLDLNNLEHVEAALADVCRLEKALTTRATDLRRIADSAW
jgi:hypothetical protein